jgi:hypothetical protein
VCIYLAKNEHDLPNTAALLLTDASEGQRYNLDRLSACATVPQCMVD